jgi:hypothetical protein
LAVDHDNLIATVACRRFVLQNNEATRDATCETTKDAHDDRHQGAMLGVSGISRRGVPRLV